MLPARRVMRFLVVLILVGAVLVGMAYLRQDTITGPFALEASEQWIVRQDQPGEIVARYSTGRREIVQKIQVFQFPRGDMIEFNVASNLAEGSQVTVGMPIMEFCSRADESMEKMLTIRTNRLSMEVALLHRQADLSKADEATTNLSLAARELDAYQQLIERRKQLVDQGILSRDELDLMEIEYSRRKLSAASAQSDSAFRHIRVQPDLATIAALELEEAKQALSLVAQRCAARWLVTPIAGRLTRFSGVPEILLRVVNEHELTARVVLPVAFMEQLKPGTPVELMFASMGVRSVTAHIERVEINPVPMMGQSVAHLLVPVPNDGGTLRMAMTGQAVVKGVKTGPFAALWWRLRLSGFNELSGERGQ